MNKEVNERMKLVNIWSKVDYKELASFSCRSHQMASVGYASPHKLSIDQSRWSYYIGSNLDERVVQSFMLLEILEIKRNQSCWAVRVEGNLGRICLSSLQDSPAPALPQPFWWGLYWKWRGHTGLLSLWLSRRAPACGWSPESPHRYRLASPKIGSLGPECLEDKVSEKSHLISKIFM